VLGVDMGFKNQDLSTTPHHDIRGSQIDRYLKEISGQSSLHHHQK